MLPNCFLKIFPIYAIYVAINTTIYGYQYTYGCQNQRYYIKTRFYNNDNPSGLYR